jgi:hypothetical protein
MSFPLVGNPSDEVHCITKKAKKDSGQAGMTYLYIILKIIRTDRESPFYLRNAFLPANFAELPSSSSMRRS